MDAKSFIKTRTATFLLSAVLVVVMFFTARILVQQHQVNGQIAKLQAQADKVKKDSDQLSYLIKYFNTSDYEEKQAREKLNLKKDGEFVVSLPDSSLADASQSALKPESNFKQWVNYFFSN
jgi:cell division protein FtsB